MFIDLFLEAHASPPVEIILDIDSTDDPVHGEQEGRFFHGYYDEWCYLPLYVFCGEDLLWAELRGAETEPAVGALPAETAPTPSPLPSVSPGATDGESASPSATPGR